MSKKLIDFIILAIFIGLAVGLYHSTAEFPKFAQKTTAIYIKFLAMSLGVLTCVQLFLSARAKNKKSNETLTFMEDPSRFFLLFIAIIFYAVALEYIGFYLSSALFLPVANIIMGYRDPKIMVIVSISILAFVYFVFSQLLGVPLPEASLF